MVINNKLADADRVTIVTQGGSGHEPAISGFVGEGMVDISRGGRRVRGTRTAGLRRRHQDGGQGKGRSLHRAEPCRRYADRQHDHEKMRERGAERRKGGDPGGHRQRPREAMPTTAAAWWAASPPTRSLAQRPQRARAWRKWQPSHSGSPTTWRLWLWPCAAPPIRPPASLLAELGDDEMEIGMGQHGEEGGGRQPMKSADETAEIMLNALINDLEHPVRREGHADLKRQRRHHSHGAVYHLPEVCFLSEGEEH